MSDRELLILNDLAAAFRDICNDCDGIPEKYVGLYDEACRAVRPLSDGQPAIDVTPTVPRAVADRLAEALRNVILCDRYVPARSGMAASYAEQALDAYRKAVARGE